MKREILLPNNVFGCLLMLLVVLLILVVPFTLVYWLLSLVAPWWVSVPSGMLVSLVAMLLTVKFKQ